MQEEVWRPIAGVEGYEVSNLGRVRSFKKKTMRIMGNGINLTKRGKDFMIVPKGLL